MIAMLQRITENPREAIRIVLGTALFGVLCGAWFVGFYFLGEYVHLTVWHWLTVGLLVFIAMVAVAVIVEVLCDRQQKEEILGALIVLGLSALLGGLAFGATKWYLPLLWRSPK